MVPGFLGEKNSKATSRGSFRHLRGPQYQNGPQKWTPRPKIDRKLPPKLLGLYQHRVDVETGSLLLVVTCIVQASMFILWLSCAPQMSSKMGRI